MIYMINMMNMIYPSWSEKESDTHKNQINHTNHSSEVDDLSLLVETGVKHS